jgi:hypothetical protein
VNPDDYYSAVADGSYSADSAHYSEVNYRGDDEGGNTVPPPSVHHSPRTHLPGPTANNNKHAHSIDQSQQVYANVSVEAKGSNQRGVYEFDDNCTARGARVNDYEVAVDQDGFRAKGPYDYVSSQSIENSQAPLIIPQVHLYSHVGTPEEWGGEGMGGE